MKITKEILEGLSEDTALRCRLHPEASFVLGGGFSARRCIRLDFILIWHRPEALFVPGGS
jgi:hypothetical protein